MNMIFLINKINEMIKDIMLIIFMMLIISVTISLLIFIYIEISPIVFICVDIVFLLKNWETICDNPFQTWLLLHLVLQIMIIIIQNFEKKTCIHEVLSLIILIMNFVLIISGFMFIIDTKDCNKLIHSIYVLVYFYSIYMIISLLVLCIIRFIEIVTIT